MRDPEVIAAMAEACCAAVRWGFGSRALNTLARSGGRSDALIIGLWKCTFPDSSVYITPGWRRSRPWSAGAM